MDMRCFGGEIYQAREPDPLDPSPISLEEGKLYQLDVGLRDGMRLPRVLLLWVPRIVMPENELRAKCVVIDPGQSGLLPGAHIEPLAHCFRRDVS
jgi:hypothetical protein